VSMVASTKFSFTRRNASCALALAVRAASAGAFANAARFAVVPLTAVAGSPMRRLRRTRSMDFIHSRQRNPMDVRRQTESCEASNWRRSNNASARNLHARIRNASLADGDEEEGGGG